MVRLFRRCAPHMIAALLSVTTCSEAAFAQPSLTPAEQSFHRLPIQIQGRTLNLDARIYRPAGPGPFPLVVINHGTPPDKSKMRGIELGFDRAAKWFVSQGFAVVVALRPGFGGSDGDYLEAAGSCSHEDYVMGGRRTAAIESLIVQSASTLPFVKADQIIVVGQSAGGFGVVALADEPPPGVLGVISFAGGRGGDGHEHICAGVETLAAADAVFGKANRLPQLWLYAANDHFFNPATAHAMAQAYQSASTPKVMFVDLPEFGTDGHQTFAKADPKVWAPDVSAFLATIINKAQR